MLKTLFALLAVLILYPSVPAYAEKPVVGFITGSSGLGDLSFNDMAYGGVRKAQQEFGFTLIVLEPKADGKTTEKDVLDLVSRSDVILLLGAQHLELARDAALKHPEKTFILVEEPVEGVPNMSSVIFKQNEGSFLAGALAALTSKTGKIGFVGGVAVPPVKAFEVGYREGAVYAAPGVEVLADYIAPAGDFSGFSDPEKANALAKSQYDKGADIVFAVAGLSGNGVIEAARQSGNLAIGVDSDQDSLAKGFVLTSMIKRLDAACYNELKAVMEGNFKAGPRYYGLENGGVSLSEMAYTRDKVPNKVMRKIEEVRQKIISGEIKVGDALSGN